MHSDAEAARVLRDALNDIDDWGDAPGDSAFVVLDLIRAAGWQLVPTGPDHPNHPDKQRKRA